MWGEDNASRGFDTAQICLNGHIINQMTMAMPERNATHCSICGEISITKCSACSTPIKGYYHSEESSFPIHEVPKFCSGCGKPYPWTGKKIQLAQELADETKGLNKKEREILKDSIVDIILETPSAEVSANRINNIMIKAGPYLREAILLLLTGFVNDSLLKLAGFK